MGIEIEIKHRIVALQEELDTRGLVGALLIDRVNVFYFSGSGRQCHLYVPSSGAPVLMVKDSLDKAKEESPLKNIVTMRDPKHIPDLLRGFGIEPAKKVAMEKLKPFNKTIEGYEYAEFKGGTKFRNGNTLLSA